MIRFLKWIGIGALIVTLTIYILCDDNLSLSLYITIFFSTIIAAWLTSFVYNRKAFFQIIYLVNLMIYFLWELIKASYLVAQEVVTPNHNMRPGIVAIPLDVKSDIGITIFSSLVTLTPGTLSLDVSVDKSHLFVHAMYIDKDNISAIVDELKNGFERRVIRILD
ncbi:MAG TPA: Na+/H+ antiporter subunit E [Dysgonamonadaceae bacterium]|nr:Na+/H+ antiporter subunit E [Dysgonamonadaceae bacterium]